MGIFGDKQPKPRTESDTMGPVEVPGDKYWGAQAERSLGPAIAAVQRRIAGTGGMRGRGLFDHARGSI